MDFKNNKCMKPILFLAASCMLLATSCGDNVISVNEPPEAGELRPLSIEAIVITSEPVSGTRASSGIITGTSLPDLSQIGVHVAKGMVGDGVNEGKPGTPYSDAFSNQMFSLSGSKWAPNQAYNLSADMGTVYAYYPFDSSARFLTPGNDATVPVSIVPSGSIQVLSGTSATGGINNSGAILAPVDGEKDYMYYAPVATRITVNNHSPIARLTMRHALAQLSFRLIKAPTYPGAGALTSYEVYDTPGKKTLVIVGSTASEMSIVSGTITHNTPVAGHINRLLTNYMLGTSTPSATIIGTLVFPVSGIAEGDITAGFSIDGEDYTVTLPVTIGSTDSWEAGKNYLYSVTLGGTGIEVTNVGVTDWVIVDGGGIDMQ